MKLYSTKCIGKKYYKYINVDFTQPILNSNGILGDNNFAVQASSEYSTTYSAWKAMNGVIQSATNAWVSAVSGNQWFTFYSPEKLKVTNLGIANNDLTARAILQYQILASNDNYTWVTLASGTNTNTGVYATWILIYHQIIMLTDTTK